MTTAVLVIDVQQGLCEGPEAAFDCTGIIARINAVTRQARMNNVPVVFLQHESEAGRLQHGSRQWQLAMGLETKTTDRFIRKTTPDSFLHTDLRSFLDEHRIKQLVICGMHTEFCVDTTIRKALALGFSVTLVDDAHTSAGNSFLTPQQVIAHHTATLTNLSSFGPRVTAVSSAKLDLSA